MAGFNIISLKLKEMYQMITLGGDAELELVDSLDPFSEVHKVYSRSKPYSQKEAQAIHHTSCIDIDLKFRLYVKIQWISSKQNIMFPNGCSRLQPQVNSSSLQFKSLSYGFLMS